MHSKLKLARCVCVLSPREGGQPALRHQFTAIVIGRRRFAGFHPTLCESIIALHLPFRYMSKSLL